MKNKKLVILGAGGMGREVLFLLLDKNTDSDYDILGFIDNTPDLQGKTINNVPVLGNDTWLLNYQDEINVIIGIGNSRKFAIKEQDFGAEITIVNPLNVL
jgi:FlaA1/EpsC-like NDP-sugar epimerase